MTEQEYAQQLTDIIRNRHERNGEVDEFGNHERIRIAIPNAKSELWGYINYKVGTQQAKGLQCYAKVAEWMTDNNGKGLICHGQCGTGKTLICRDILPLLIEHHARRKVRCYTAQKMVEDLDSILKLSNSIIYIDDVGTEPETTRKYGVERHPFAELCDAAEQNYNLLILSSNLRMIPNPKRPDYPSFLVRYGERTYDRLKALTRTALFIGESMRK